MSNFYSQSNLPPKSYSPKTDATFIKYEKRIGKDAKPYLKEVDRIDLYDKVQQSMKSVDLNEIIKTYKLRVNDMDLTKLSETAITDLTTLPDNTLDAANKILDARNIYNKMPTSVKETFHNNFYEFLQGAENGTLQSLLDAAKPAPVDTVQPVTPVINEAPQGTTTNIVTNNSQNIQQGGVNLYA